jgi:hypothetical protein
VQRRCTGGHDGIDGDDPVVVAIKHAAKPPPQDTATTAMALVTRYSALA